MTGVLLEQLIVHGQVPDLAHIVETHRILRQLPLGHEGLDLNVLIREVDHPVADVLEAKVQGLGLQRREKIL